MSNIFQLIIKYIKKIKNISILPFIGFILISLYFWGRYLRIRLPRDIPFNLTSLSFLFLVCLCCSYIYIIYRLFNPKMPPQFIINYIHYIQNIIKSFDDYLKQFRLVIKGYKLIFSFLAKKINANNFNLWKKLLIIIDTLPQVILLIALIIDIFYFHKLFYFYKTLWVTLILFIIPFSLHSFNYINELLIHYWEQNTTYVATTYIKVWVEQLDHHDDDDDDDSYISPPGFMFIPFRTFIEVYFNEIYFEINTPNFSYAVSPTKEWMNDFFKKYNHNWESSFDKLKDAIIAKDIDLIIQLTAIMRSYNIIIKHTNISYIQKYLKIIIYIGYLICWGYILIVSFHTLNDFSIILENVNTYIIKTKIWSPLKIILFLTIMKLLHNNNE